MKGVGGIGFSLMTGAISKLGIERAEHSVSAAESHFWFWGGGVSSLWVTRKMKGRPVRSENIKIGCRSTGDKKKPHALGGA